MGRAGESAFTWGGVVDSGSLSHSQNLAKATAVGASSPLPYNLVRVRPSDHGNPAPRQIHRRRTRAHGAIRGCTARACTLPNAIADSALPVDTTRSRCSCCPEHTVGDGHHPYTAWFSRLEAERRRTTSRRGRARKKKPEFTESLTEMSLPQPSCHCRGHVACRILPMICHAAH